MALDFLDHLGRDSDRFLTLLADADPGLRVPTCPDWTADDLLWHLASVQWFWATIVRDRVQDPDPLVEPERPADRSGLVAFFAEQTGLLRETLAATDPATEVWMWAEDHSVGYVRRRMAHEAFIHRLDAEFTVEQVSDLDRDLASDGIDEALTHFFGGVPPWGTFTPSGSHLLVAATDTDLEMTLRLGSWKGTSPNTGTVYDEAAVEVVDAVDAGTTVRGTAADLDRWLWGRGPRSALSVDGDQDAFDVLAGIVANGVD